MGLDICDADSCHVFDHDTWRSLYIRLYIASLPPNYTYEPKLPECMKSVDSTSICTQTYLLFAAMVDGYVLVWNACKEYVSFCNLYFKSILIFHTTRTNHFL